MNTSFDGTNARLIIRKVTSKYVANYRVVIKNEFGEDESSADLTLVEEKVSINALKVLDVRFFLKYSSEKTQSSTCNSLLLNMDFSHMECYY